MLKDFVENEVKLLSIISRLVVTGRQSTDESILRIIEIKVPDISDCWEEAADLGKDSHVLELGCGKGLITEYMSDITKSHITGIDIGVEAITSANNRTGKRDRLVFDGELQRH